MEKTPDRRVQRTRRLLHKALMSCILEKKYESITVQEILDRADVGRSTFYVHFRDKDELLTNGFQYCRAFLNRLRKSRKQHLEIHTRESSDSVYRCSSTPWSTGALTAHYWGKVPRAWCAAVFIPSWPVSFHVH